ncbi:MAG: SMP-30/gluconolactonase/LRE family protein [Rhodanobacter sp.]|jgi:L-arabinonolactonase
MSEISTLSGMQVAADVRNTLGEGIVWCDRAQALYWTDIPRAVLYRLYPASGYLEQWSMPERLASFALCEADGWLLLALASRLAFFRLADGRIETLHEVEPGLPTRCNDGACDRQGRFVFGTLHEPAQGDKQAIGSFWRLNHDLSMERLELPRVAISNSIAFSPDGRTMYFCDSPSRRIQRCDYGDLPGTPRLFADLGDLDGEPDGSCVDADGNLWNAQWGLSRVVCYGPDGAVRRVLPLLTSQPTRPAFGGEQLDQLYVTSARDGLSAAVLAGQPHAGALFHAAVDTHGLVEPRFLGTPESLIQ